MKAINNSLPNAGGVAYGDANVASALDSLTTTVNGKITGSGIANNLTTTSSGYALDARQGKTLNDAIACSHVSITSWKGSTITRLVGYMTKIGKFITITGAWEGSATNTQDIMTIPSQYRPSYDITSGGSGFIQFSSTNIVSAEYSMWTGGSFRQATNTSAAIKGSFTISYHLA